MCASVFLLANKVLKTTMGVATRCIQTHTKSAGIDQGTHLWPPQRYVCTHACVHFSCGRERAYVHLPAPSLVLLCDTKLVHWQGDVKKANFQ